MSQKRESVLTVKTHDSAKSKLDDLANRISANKWGLPFDSVIRECSSKSGIVHHLISENITISEIKAELQKIESE